MSKNKIYDRKPKELKFLMNNYDYSYILYDTRNAKRLQNVDNFFYFLLKNTVFELFSETLIYSDIIFIYLFWRS
jgi:hypothetical protein